VSLVPTEVTLPLVATMVGLAFAFATAARYSLPLPLENGSMTAARIAEKNKLNHRARLITAAIWVPLVPGLCVANPAGMTIFLGLASWLAVYELEAAAAADTGATTKKKVSKAVTTEAMPKRGRSPARKAAPVATEEPAAVEAHVLTGCGWITAAAAAVVSSAPGLVEAVLQLWWEPRYGLLTPAAHSALHERVSGATFTAALWLVILAQMRDLAASGAGGALASATEFRAAGIHLARRLFSLLWISYALRTGAIVLVSRTVPGQWIVAALLLGSWTADSAGYYTGKTLGKRGGGTPAFPRISPAKTIEGCIAATLSVLAASAAFAYAAHQPTSTFLGSLGLPRIAPVHYLVFGTLVGIGDVAGDLAESFVKRVLGIKDSGNYFRGHGGVLDRFDSFFLIAPAVHYYVHLAIAA
jgi:CDP-diglyceride synthetase